MRLLPTRFIRRVGHLVSWKYARNINQASRMSAPLPPSPVDVFVASQFLTNDDDRPDWTVERNPFFEEL